MSVAKLQNYLPDGTFPFLKEWFGEYFIHIKITKDRGSKLGDYRKMPDGSHQITVNSTLVPDLFFFVLTHELAHLIAFETFGRNILPHGTEWKNTFREMLVKSASVYAEALRPLILNFSKNPRANFMASPDLVRYFRAGHLSGDFLFIEKIRPGEYFKFNAASYEMLGRRKMNYLCKNLLNGKEYIFKPLAEVRKIEQHERE